MHSHWAQFLNHAMEWIQHSGWWGVIGFVVLYSLTCVFFLPGSFLTVGAGAVYGFWYGTLLVMVSSTMGAVINFLTSRYLARTFVARYLMRSSKMQAFERSLDHRGWQIILLSRISPIVPHSLVSYAAGLTKMPFWRYTVASWIGFIPLSVAYSYGGAVVGKVAKVSAGVGTHNATLWLFYGLGGVATILVTVLMTQAATSALKSRVGAVDEGAQDSPRDETAQKSQDRVLR